MPRTLRAALLALLLAGSLGLGAQALVPPFVQLTAVASGFSAPLFATHAGDGSGRLFVVEQTGRVRVLDEGALDPVAYLDLTAKVSCCGERGLLGLAFHPDFEDNGRLFVSYTRAGDGASVLERLTVADPANGRPGASGEVLLVVAQPFSNHNGGWVAFGPDGYLYLALGDGGSGGDPFNNAQNKNSLLGKMLRLDVDVASGYGIPPTNPYQLLGGGRPEIWALGLRNPWRASFDRITGDLWIGDVGQGAWEEVNLQPRLSLGGENYGWRNWEGNHAYAGGSAAGMTFPVFEYAHNLGCSVTGGYVYRGLAAPALTGLYLYGDFCSGRVWAGQAAPRPALPLLPQPLPVVPTSVQIMDTPYLISSFGEDELGDVYLVHYGGTVFKFTTT